MANNDLAFRFTENVYATKSEVSKELKMSLIDNIWSNIQGYRSSFNHYLTIKSIEKNALVFCICPAISTKINEVNVKLLRLTSDYFGLSSSSGDLSRFEDKCIGESLKIIAKMNDVDIDDMYIRNLLHGDLKDNGGSFEPVINYYRALDFISKKYASPIDVDFLAELYSIITNNPQLTSFYRTEEDRNPENRVIIDRIYSAAPTAYIESMMESLFSFIANSSLNCLVKALVTYYYVSYIKPFPKYSDEIALLLAKAVLAHNNFQGLGACLPLESLLTEDLNTVGRIFIEVQKTNDVTYFVNYGLKLLQQKCDMLLDILANEKSSQLKRDFYREDVEPAAPEAVSEPVVEEPVPEKKAEVEEEVKVVKEVIEPKPVVEAPVQERPVVQEKAMPRQEVREEIAFGYIPPVIDEKAACRLEEHLLELDPSMKRGEAKFYARHCTIGKRYTIQQYKKAIGCAYETARTSMDHLVAMGYYRKEMVKNKNVYTPIPKK